MKLTKTIVLPIALLCVTLTGCSKNNDENSEATNPVPYTGNYYNDPYFSMESTGSTLLSQLHYLSIAKHTKAVRYADFSAYTRASTKPRSIDQSPTNEDKNVFFYTGKEVSKSTGFTREHVWPCANSGGLWVHDKTAGEQYYVDGSTYVGGGSDLYHVRPSTSAVNTARGNSKFTEFKSTDVVYESTDGGPYRLLVDKDPAQGFATKSEPCNEYKGDIARILLYVFVRYNKVGSYNDKYCGTLSLMNVIAAESNQEAQEILSRWNKLDPVDDLERLRNDTIEQIQGNRNPFVDHPEFVDRMFNIGE